MNLNLLLKTFITLFVAVVFFNTSSYAQQANLKVDSLASKRKQTVFFELLGAGLLYSANYDTRFSNMPDGLGARVGIGFTSLDGKSFFSAPVQLNYLLGNGNKFFEIGVGATYLSINDREHDDFDFNDDDIFLDFDDGKAVFGTLNFGYRYQPANGFSFRTGITPIFNSNGFLPYWFNVSFGYAF